MAALFYLSGQLGTAQLGLAQLGQFKAPAGGQINASGKAPIPVTVTAMVAGASLVTPAVGAGAGSGLGYRWYELGELEHRMIIEGLKPDLPADSENGLD